MKWPLWRRQQDRQLDEELRSHLALAIQDRIDRGESPEHAAEAARREFGNVLLVRETVRDMWGWTPIEQFWQDLGYARRALWKARAFTVAAVLTLSLGIGANTAMFSVVRAVILRPLPFAEPDRLVAVNETDLRSATPRAVVGLVAGFLRLAQRYANAGVNGRVSRRQLHRHRTRSVSTCAWRRRLGESLLHARCRTIFGSRISRGRRTRRRQCRR